MGKDFGKLTSNALITGSKAATLAGVNRYESLNDLMNYRVTLQQLMLAQVLEERLFQAEQL